jgi:hypothetical protein
MSSSGASATSSEHEDLVAEVGEDLFVGVTVEDHDRQPECETLVGPVAPRDLLDFAAMPLSTENPLQSPRSSAARTVCAVLPGKKSDSCPSSQRTT